MSDISVSNTNLRLKLILNNAAKDAYRTTRRTALYTLVWQWLGIVASLFMLDLMFGLPVWLRWIALAGQAVYLAVGLSALFRSGARFGSSDEWAARVVEERHPELDNALIHAVQFARVLPTAGPDQAGLIDRELRRAEQTAASIPLREAPNSRQEQIAIRRMAIMLSAWALVGVLFSGGFMAIMPRLFLPWLDEKTPPFSQTKFDVRPPGATVRYDDSLTISVHVSGRAPESMALMTQSQGKTWHRVAMDPDGAGAYSVKLDALRDDTAYYVQAATGRSAEYHVTVTRPPTVSAMKVTYTYPSYTGRKPSTETLGPDGVHGLPGTGVAMAIVSNRDLKGGILEVRSAEGAVERIPVEADPKAASHALVKFSIRRPGEYHLALTAIDDQTSADAAHGKIKLDKDQRPAVWFTFPGQDLLVTADMRVPLKVKATDDNAVAQVQIHRHLNDKPDQPSYFAGAPFAKEVEFEQTIDLAACGAHAGDQISYFGTAVDNAPGTPNVGETEVYTLKVVTKEEFAEALKEQRQASDLAQESHDMADTLRSLAEQQKELASRMEQVQRQLEKKPGDAALQKQMSEAKSDEQALQKQAKQLSEDLANYSQSPSATDLERALKKKIAEIAGKLGAAAQGAMQQAQSAESAKSAASSREAAKLMAQMQKQMEQQVQKALQYIEEVLPLYNDLARFKELLEQQKQLVQKAQSFQNKGITLPGDTTRMTMLADQQSSNARELAQIKKDLVEHAVACEDHFAKAAGSARRIAAEIESRGIVALMSGAKDHFRAWEGGQGYSDALSAQEQMEAMISKCEGGSGQQGMESELDIALKECLGDSGLGSCLNPFSLGLGMGPSGGMGIGSGMGMSGQGGSATRGGKAYVPSVSSISGTGGNKKMRHANHVAGTPAGLSNSEIEVVKASAASPRKSGDTGGNSYPAEYRKLIQDYFKSVADKQ